MKWEKSVVKSVLLESKPCLFHNDYFSPLPARAWGLREQESFFALYHHMLVRLLEVKLMKVKPMNLWEVKPTKCGGLHPQEFFTLTLVHTQSPSACKNCHLNGLASSWLQKLLLQVSRSLLWLSGFDFSFRTWGGFWCYQLSSSKSPRKFDEFQFV